MSHQCFTWTKDLEIGVPELDEQHRYFYDLANSILGLQDKLDVTREEILVAIGKMGDYAFFHFDTEEVMLHKLSGQEVDDHIKKHDAYRAEIKKFIAMVTAQESDVKQLAEEVATFACEYVDKHMLNVSKESILKKL